MENRVYVGNLAWSVAWQDLKDHFKDNGFNPDHAEVFTESSGRSRGCGVVSMPTAGEAARAIKEMHDTILHERQIFVREDREAEMGRARGRGNASRNEYSSRGGGEYSRGDDYGNFGGGRGRGRGGGGRGGRPSRNESGGGKQLFVGNLAWETNDDILFEEFSKAGKVVRAEVAFNAQGRSRGNGIVVMSSEEEADRAIQDLNGLMLGGRDILVKLDQYA